MQSRILWMRRAGAACLLAAGLAAAVLALPSPRTRIAVPLSGGQMRSAWVSLDSAAVPADPPPVPSLTLLIDLPRSVLRGREEQIRLRIDVLSEGTPPTQYSAAAQIVSVDAQIEPPGVSGQPLRVGIAFTWNVVASRVPEAAATLLVRLRRHSPEGAAEVERLVLARDIALPVRTVAGLSAPVARVAAAVMGLGGALLGIASSFLRKR